MSQQEDAIDRQILATESRLSRYLVLSLTRLDQRMSDLTDKIDTALTTLQSRETASADTITQQQATISAAAAAADGLQAQITDLAAGKAADETELQKVLDVLNALQNPPGTPVAPPVVAGTGAAPAPVDPVPVDAVPVVDPNAPAPVV